MDHLERNWKIIEAISKRTEEMISGPNAKEKCIKYLIHLGIYNEDGSLHYNYGGK